MQCVNERRCILKMDYKRQTTVLSIMFVLVGMIFLVPTITEKAEASINATVKLHWEAAGGAWRLVNAHMHQGQFTTSPTKRGDQIVWATKGIGIQGSENGYVKYERFGLPGEQNGDVTFLFSNPSSGKNTCEITTAPPLHGDCSITQGNTASASYNVYYFSKSADGSGEDNNPGGSGGDNNPGGSEGDDSGDTP
jgi:hypothetical protein